MSAVYAVQLHCEHCDRRDVWETSIPLQPNEKVVIQHLCSERSSGPYLVSRERK